MKIRRNIVIAAMSLAFMGAGLTGVAHASGGAPAPSSSHSQTSTQDDDANEGKEAKESESPGDEARQTKACEAAGISPSATNVDYDDETGICKLDSGDDEGGQDGGTE